MPSRTDMTLILAFAALGGCSNSPATPENEARAAPWFGPTPQQVMKAAADCGIKNAETYHVGEESNGLRITSGVMTQTERECLKKWQDKNDVRFEINA